MAATSRIEKKAVKVKHRAEQLDGHLVKRWKRALDFTSESPKGVKAAMHEMRLRGSGSAPDLSADTILFMDSCSVHDSEKTTASLRDTDISFKFFPPNCRLSHPLQAVVQPAVQLRGVRHSTYHAISLKGLNTMYVRLSALLNHTCPPLPLCHSAHTQRSRDAEL